MKLLIQENEKKQNLLFPTFPRALKQKIQISQHIK